MKCYIATGLENTLKYDEVQQRLYNIGVDVTYNWTTHGAVWQEWPERIREVAVKESEGVQKADFVVVILPGGRGTHTELGMAISSHLPVLLLHENESNSPLFTGEATCTFYHHPLCMRITTLDELILWVSGYKLATRVCI
jgi:hypothetical protein